MHTLLPYDDFKLSALALTDHLLREQIIDVTRAMEALHETERAEGNWNHLTVQAWRGYELQLCEFGLTCVDQALKRDPTLDVDHTIVNHHKRLEWHLDMAEGGNMSKPPWFGIDWVHTEYQGLLLHLDPEHYSVIFPNVQPCPPERFRYPTVKR